MKQKNLVDRSVDSKQPDEEAEKGISPRAVKVEVKGKSINGSM